MDETNIPTDEERRAGDFEVVLDTICYFCGEEIAATPLDPCLMGLEFQNGIYGEVAAHTDCLVRAQHPSIHFDPR